MIQSYKQHISATYTPGERKDIFIDNLLSFTPLTNAKFVFYNNDDTAIFHVIVYNWLMLGINDDPLSSGNFDYEISNTSVGTGRYEVVLNGSIDDGVTQYSIAAINTSSHNAILHVMIEGTIDSASMVSIPT